MPRVRKENAWEELIGSPNLARIYEVLLYADEPIQQHELARRARMPEVTVKRILRNLTEEPLLSNAFISQKIYNARVYSMNNSHPIYGALKKLYESVMKK